MRVLVLGATGYIGSRLVPHLLEHGHDVVAASSSPPRPDRFGWDDRVRAIRCDVTDPAAVAEAVEDVDAVVYLVHSLDRSDFSDRDRVAAETVAAAVADERRTTPRLPLGLVPDVPEADLSAHIASRLEVERILLGAIDGAVALRAGVVIGAGSTSFEIIRQIATLFLVQPVPTWMQQLGPAGRRLRRAARDHDGLADDGPSRCGGPRCPRRRRLPRPAARRRRRGRAVARPRAGTRRPHRARRPRARRWPRRRRSTPSPRSSSRCATTWSAGRATRGRRATGGPLLGLEEAVAAGDHRRRTSAPRARCPPTRPGPGRALLDVVPSPPPSGPARAPPPPRIPPRTPDGRYLRTWRSWTGREPSTASSVSVGGRSRRSRRARRLDPCPSR